MSQHGARKIVPVSCPSQTGSDLGGCGFATVVRHSSAFLDALIARLRVERPAGDALADRAGVVTMVSQIVVVGLQTTFLSAVAGEPQLIAVRTTKLAVTLTATRCMSDSCPLPWSAGPNGPRNRS